MKKWLVLALIACLAVAVQAKDDEGEKKGGKDKPVKMNQYIAQQKKMAEKKGEEFDQEAAEKKFAKLDKNEDGVLTEDEMPQKKGKKKKDAATGDE